MSWIQKCNRPVRVVPFRPVLHFIDCRAAGYTEDIPLFVAVKEHRAADTDAHSADGGEEGGPVLHLANDVRRVEAGDDAVEFRPYERDGHIEVVEAVERSGSHRPVDRAESRRVCVGADERDRAKFQKAASYMVLLDDKVMCKNMRCRKRFDVSGVKTMAFI